MKRLISYIIMIVCSLPGYAQHDNRPIIGVTQFSCEQESPYTGLITEKVVEMLTNTKRFQVVDRTSIDKIQEELELQKSEAFIDSKNRVEQDIAIAAEKLITGHIIKIPVYRIKNNDGTVRGYKASVAFQMKIVDVATGLSSEATSFHGKASKENLSPESAVAQAMLSTQDLILEYFRTKFPVSANINRIISEKNGIAKIVLLSAGIKQGINIGDKFNIESIELINGEPYPSTIGTATVIKLAGESFCECSVDKKTGSVVSEKIKSNATIACKLIIPN